MRAVIDHCRDSSARATLMAAVAGCVASGCVARDEAITASADHRNAEYQIEDRRVTLVDGRAEAPAAPGSATMLVTSYFGNEARADLNGDGRDDVVFVLTQELGGSGTFYYVVAALAENDRYVGSRGLLLGDRIAPQSVEIDSNGIITVSYADRAPGESFTTPPSVGKSIRLKLDAESLQFGEVAQDFAGEADPARMRLDMKAWVWVGARRADGTELVPQRPDVFTLTFGADGRFNATTDCNRVGGSYTTGDGGALTFGDVFATRMFCEGSQENEFSALLDAVVSYRFTARGQLLLALDADSGTVEFR
jgi:heat shock protein HslJ